MSAPQGQDLAYERAVLRARSDPAMAEVVSSSFLQEDLRAALAAFSASEHMARMRRLLSELGVEPPARVLDLGGGRGLVAGSLAGDGFRAVLCEPNPSEVCGAGAGRRLSAILDHGFEVHNGFVGELSGGEPFDAVVCRAVLHHIHPLQPVLEDVFGALRPGGAFVASDEPTIDSPEQLETVLREHPFVADGVEEWAGPASHYAGALRDAGFTEVRDRFPVTFGDYRRSVRPDLAIPLAVLGYTRYRLASALRPHPPMSRSFTARKPLA